MRATDLLRTSAGALLIAGTLAATPASLSGAEALFMAAREARSHSGYAHYSVYATTVRYRRGEREITSTWDTIEDMQRRIVHAHSLPREEAARPHVPHGTSVGVYAGRSGPIMGIPPKGAVINAEPPEDPIGQLSFAVDQDFGLALDAAPISAARDMRAVAATVTTLPHIGRTGTIARTYEVTDLGDVDEAGAAMHHIGLRPLRDPRRYRLRELWTDAKTSLPMRAVVAGIGNRSPLQDIEWRVDFTQFQGGTYVAREIALAPLQTRYGSLDAVTITFGELRATNRLTPLESLGLSGEVGTTDP